ncbi:hypothetical protein [Spirosoma linguale]|uniref:Response regulatory domain-containing protein n=1 Tax=Spirosoma linguale (strain ATCC 33905 / DSM 74 / LMG 10896 / Claus 1) TaxID=504472 RepID=D2QI54_SPILD|nr:hypothetical protein Slin_0888 [Spirosoma linguale DSM 74]
MELTTSQRITCGIIEKAAVHRTLLKSYIARMPELELIWETEFQETSYAQFENYIPDLIFISLYQLPVEIVPLLKPILVGHMGIIITSDYYLKDVGNIPFSFAAYLQKPFSFKEFTASVEQYKYLSKFR